MNEDIGQALEDMMAASLSINNISVRGAFLCDDPQTRNLTLDILYLPDVSAKRYS